VRAEDHQQPLAARGLLEGVVMSGSDEASITSDVISAIRYVGQCYEADNRETGIPNLFHKKYRHVTFLSGSEDLASGVLDRVPIERGLALAAEKEAALYRKDKTLVYCLFPLVGDPGSLPHLPSPLCAPVLYYPATIDDDGSVAYLAIDRSQQRMNAPVIAALVGGENGSSVDDLLKQFPQAPLGRDGLHTLIALLMDVLPEVDALGLTAFPQLVSEKHVRRAMRQSEPHDQRRLHCLPAAAVALIPNSPDTRGALYELAALADGRPVSTPLGAVLNPPKGFFARSDAPAGSVPAVLSRPQQRVLRSAASVPLTLVVGPPGTGKSYTIAALAIDHVARGESVLIASRMDHAVDVVAKKIEEMIGPSPCILRGGRHQYIRELKRFLEQILHGIQLDPPVATQDFRRMKREVARAERTVLRLERLLVRQCALEERWGVEAALSASDRFAAGLRRKVVLGYLGWQLGKTPLWDMAREYEEAIGGRSNAVRQLVRATLARRLAGMLHSHRGDLTRFLHAIRARGDRRQEKLFSEIRLDVLLGTFPVWLVNLAHVSEVLPLERELFDVAILDEATQCDIASCLPVFQRAKRAVVVGDPSQLRHVCFLSRERQQAIAEHVGLGPDRRASLDYREKSILDLLSETIGSQSQVHFLDEHFRSMPDIIAFSNREFYADSLKVLTQRPETAGRRCVEMHFVAGGRKEGSANKPEADALVDEVVRRVETEAGLPAAARHSMGVLSPLRDQVDYISAQLDKRLSIKSIQTHDLLVGTAHTFQGEERDVMYLSLAVDRRSHPATFLFIINPNVFNVSITRARNEQYVFCSVEPDDLKPGTLLRRYLERIGRGPTDSERLPDSPPDAVLSEVQAELQREGFRTFTAYPLAGRKIDLMVERHGRTIGIDLIGCPGLFAAAIELDRYRTLQRAGLPLMPLPYRAWKADRRACIAAVVAWHEGMGGCFPRRPSKVEG